MTLSTPDTDPLFRLPLAEFTSARNALAAQLKKSGKRDEAERVKALAKPSIPAWAVNQLYWRHRKAFDRLMASGEQFRKAQAAQLAGKSADLRRPLESRREALGELSRLAAETLAASDHQPTPDMMRRITTTLEALSTYGDTPNGPTPGRLLDDVEPPGFETLAALVPAIGGDAQLPGNRHAVLPFHKAQPAKASKPSAKDGRDAEEELKLFFGEAIPIADRDSKAGDRVHEHAHGEVDEPRGLMEQPDETDRQPHEREQDGRPHHQRLQTAGGGMGGSVFVPAPLVVRGGKIHSSSMLSRRVLKREANVPSSRARLAHSASAQQEPVALPRFFAATSWR